MPSRRCRVPGRVVARTASGALSSLLGRWSFSFSSPWLLSGLGTSQLTSGRPVWPPSFLWAYCQVITVQQHVADEARQSAGVRSPTAPEAGPETALSDEELVEEIRTVLKASPFLGEGQKPRNAKARLAAEGAAPSGAGAEADGGDDAPPGRIEASVGERAVVGSGGDDGRRDGGGVFGVLRGAGGDVVELPWGSGDSGGTGGCSTRFTRTAARTTGIRRRRVDETLAVFPGIQRLGSYAPDGRLVDPPSGAEAQSGHFLYSDNRTFHLRPTEPVLVRSDD